MTGVAGASETVPRWQKIALAVCLFFITGSFGFLQPFTPLYITASGLSKADYGWVIAIGTATTLMIQPILGKLSDRYDSRRPFMILAALAALIAYESYRHANSLITFTLLTVIGVNGFNYLNAVGGVLVGRIARREGGGAAYARYRVWGSVGYIIIGMGAGLLINPPWRASALVLGRAQLDPLFVWGPLLFLLVVAASLFVPDPRADRAVQTPSVASDAIENAAASRANLNRFLLAFFLYIFALYGASAYLPLYMKSLGARPLWITGMFAAGVICEVLVMTQVGRWTDRYGRRPALAFALLLMPIRLLLYIPATGPLWVLVVQMLHGINFGVVGTIAIVFVNDLAPEHQRGQAQARLAATQGLAVAAGLVVCGQIAEQFGIRVMFGTMSVFGVMAAFLFFTQVRESHPSPEPLPVLWLRRWFPVA